VFTRSRFPRDEAKYLQLALKLNPETSRRLLPSQTMPLCRSRKIPSSANRAGGVIGLSARERRAVHAD
jgi:hypothetical protein